MATAAGEVNVTYERKKIRCGKARCRCNTADENQWHGPYWYAFWNDPKTGKKRAKYVGKKFDAPRQKRADVHSERRRAPDQETRRERERQAPPPPPPPREEQRRHAPPPRPSRAEQDARDAAFFGVGQDVGERDLKRAWRDKIAAAHPDRYPAGAERDKQERIAQEINEAHQRMRKYRGW